MIFYNGLWHYRGAAYPTLRAALLTVWPGRKETEPCRT